MKLKTNLFSGAMLLLCLNSIAQTIPAARQLPAKRTIQKVKIDGTLDEAAWKDAAVANGLIEFRPKVGSPEEPTNRTETYLMYDDEGIYFGGYLYERTKDSIAAELKGRDDLGNNDFIEIIFARRTVNTVENILSAKYNFTNKTGITFRTRHYLSTVDNKDFLTLQNDGKLKANTTFNKNTNRNVNIFNIDMVYTWQFAPGSFVNIVWKNAAFDSNNLLETNYFKN